MHLWAVQNITHVNEILSDGLCKCAELGSDFDASYTLHIAISFGGITDTNKLMIKHTFLSQIQPWMEGKNFPSFCQLQNVMLEISPTQVIYYPTCK